MKRKAVFLFSSKENEHRKKSLTEKSSFSDFGAKRPFRTSDAAVKRKAFFYSFSFRRKIQQKQVSLS